MEISSAQSEIEHYNLGQSLRLELPMGCLHVSDKYVK